MVRFKIWVTHDHLYSLTNSWGCSPIFSFHKVVIPIGLFIYLISFYYYYNVIVSNTHQNKGAFVRSLSLLFISKDHVSEVQMMHFILRHPYVALT
jgi:hypothetical protein